MNWHIQHNACATLQVMLKNKFAKHDCSTKEHTNSKQPAPTIVPHAGQTQGKHIDDAIAQPWFCLRERLSQARGNAGTMPRHATVFFGWEMVWQSKKARQTEIRCNAMAKQIKALAKAKPRMTSRAQSIEDMFIYLPIPDSLKKQQSANNYAITM